MNKEQIKETILNAKRKNSVVLELINCNLKFIPSEIYEMTNLEKLLLSDNEIEFIDPQIKNLQNLTSLILYNNKIKKLPEEIYTLPKLEGINVRKNKIKYLSSNIQKLKKLRYIYIEKNPIETFPLELGQLENIEQIRFDSRIKNIPPEIATKGTKAILNYLKEIYHDDNTPLFEAKLLLVGSGGVGKTSMMKRLKYNRFKESEKTTEGIDIVSWNIKTKSKDKLRINIWDFGGQEIYHATHQFFLTKRSLYLLIWTARTDDNLLNFDYWLSVIKLLSSGSPVIVVLNKTDERVKNINESYFQEKFPNILSFHKTSVKKNKGIKQLVEEIVSETIKLDHIGDLLPSVWVDIRKRLERLKKDYITYKEYLTICDEFDVDEERAKFLSNYYHDLGVFLHFQDNPILKELIFINPEWATDAVYQLIDTKEIIQNYGRFELNKLEQYWYHLPRDKHIFLVEIMKKFELCFQVKDSSIMIIPELLSEEKPSDIKWNYANNVIYEFKYAFLPKGLISRLISINHHYILNSYYWKNGLLIEFENTNALIIQHPLEKKVTIRINGNQKNTLFSIIRRDLDYLHTTLNHPEFNSFIACNCNECKSSNNPHMFDFKLISKLIRKKDELVMCQKSTLSIPIDSLVGLINYNEYAYKQEIYKLFEKLISKKEIRDAVESDNELTKQSILFKINDKLILKPSFFGLGLDLNKILSEFLLKKKIEDKQL